MAVEARELDHEGGVVLVCNTTDTPLSLSINVFADLEEANDFLDWLRDSGRDARTEDNLDQTVADWFNEPPREKDHE